MADLKQDMGVFKDQLALGYVTRAYAGLLRYIHTLKGHFKKTHPEMDAPGGLYFGYMDMTYFALVPEFLKAQKLKIAVVFQYETFTFEVWLSGANRGVQAAFWEKIKASGWRDHPLAKDPEREDFIVKNILIEDPDFGDLENLTGQIEAGTLVFIEEMRNLLDTV